MINARKIWSSSQLPTLPTVAIKLLELSRDPETEIKDIVAVIKSDPATSSKILKATNSSFFGFSSKVSSLERAVPLLGTTVVTSLALSFSVVEAAMTSGPLVEHYNRYWMQSVVQGVAADVLSAQSGEGLACEYFLSGLLMDLGQLAMLKTVSEEYLPVLEAASQQERDLHSIETELLGINHIEVGLKLMENWNLPTSVRGAVKFHHASLEQLIDQSNTADFELIKVTAVAASVGKYYCSTNKGRALERLRRLTAEFYNFAGKDLCDFLSQTKTRVEDAGELFSIDADELGDPGDLMAEANEQLAQLAMREHVVSTQAVARQQAVEREKQELESRNEQLQKQALRDPLTGIYNRYFFDESLGKELSRCYRTAAPIGVIFSDIDRFKRLNDTYGHQFGDLVLQRVAQAFAKVVRKSDVLARYGGEEFVILAIQPTEKGLEKVAERIRACVEAEEIYFEGKRVPVTVSVGAAVAIPRRSDPELAKRLVRAADEAMYESKQNGRNQVHMHSLLSEKERRLAQQVMARRFSRWMVSRKILDVITVSEALSQCQMQRIRIGDLAQQRGYLNESQVEQILAEQQLSDERFGEIAIRLGLLREEHLSHLLALQQEEPLALAKILVHLGQIEQDYAPTLLKQYEIESAPAAIPTPSPESSIV